MEGRNTFQVINGGAIWNCASFATRKKVCHEFIEHCTNLRKLQNFVERSSLLKASEEIRSPQIESISSDDIQFRLWYLLDFHHRGTIMLRDELQVVPGCLALALQFPDVRRELVEVDFRCSCHSADLNKIHRLSLVSIFKRHVYELFCMK